jgi:protein phosphatase
LRIIYFPDSTDPNNLSRLRERNLAQTLSMALRKYTLGMDARERVASDEPLGKIHQAVFAVLAMESEPVDPEL